MHYIYNLMIIYTYDIYTYATEYYSAIKKSKILPFVTTGIDLEGIVLSEICQTEKDKYHMISFIREI